jgi:hypothetical protein
MQLDDKDNEALAEAVGLKSEMCWISRTIVAG